MRMATRVVSLHGALWNYDRWYRLSWYLGPGALALVAIGWICIGKPVDPTAGSWGRSVKQTETNGKPRRNLVGEEWPKCFATNGQFSASKEACSWLINSGMVNGRQLASVFVQRGLLQRRKGHDALADNEASLKDYNDALRVSPDFPDALTSRAWVRMARGEHSAAIEDLNKAIRVLPPLASAVARYYRGYAFLKLENYPDALTDLNEAQKYQPNNAEVYLTRGEVKQAQENHEAALQDFDEFIARSPKDPRGLVWRSFVLEATGRTQEALAALESALALEPDNETFRAERDRLQAKLAAGTAPK